LLVWVTPSFLDRERERERERYLTSIEAADCSSRSLPPF
jgi:hypothetical protein